MTTERMSLFGLPEISVSVAWWLKIQVMGAWVLILTVHIAHIITYNEKFAGLWLTIMIIIIKNCPLIEKTTSSPLFFAERLVCFRESWFNSDIKFDYC